MRATLSGDLAKMSTHHLATLTHVARKNKEQTYLASSYLANHLGYDASPCSPHERT